MEGNGLGNKFAILIHYSLQCLTKVQLLLCGSLPILSHNLPLWFWTFGTWELTQGLMREDQRCSGQTHHDMSCLLGEGDRREKEVSI